MEVISKGGGRGDYTTADGGVPIAKQLNKGKHNINKIADDVVVDDAVVDDVWGAAVDDNAGWNAQAPTYSQATTNCSDANALRATDTKSGKDEVRTSIVFKCFLKNVMSLMTEDLGKLLSRDSSWDAAFIKETWRPEKEELWQTPDGHLLAGA